MAAAVDAELDAELDAEAEDAELDAETLGAGGETNLQGFVSSALCNM